MKYLVYIMHSRNPEQNMRSGYYEIIEASSASEAKKRGVEELVLKGKGLPGLSVSQNMSKSRVEKYKGSW